MPKLLEREEEPTVQMVNLGCPKNEVDSEEMLGVLSRSGYRIDGHGRTADVVVINTCGFIQSAKQESIDSILEALERKKRGEVGSVVVTGCLAQRYGPELAKEMPEVDAFLGTGQMADVADVVTSVSKNGSARGREKVKDDGFILHPSDFILPKVSSFILVKPHHRWLDVPTRIRSTAPWTAYLKISEGCGHRCTFCAIPSFRGAHVSKPLDRILQEAEMLAGQGVKELNLIAQDSTQYGYDLYRKPMLPSLLKQLSQVDGIRWIRLFYCYPSRVNAAVIEAIAGTPKVCQYIDMPLQHADDEILRSMRRPMSGGAYLKLIERFRDASPDVAIRTTFIVGFPGETDAHFATLEAFVEQAQFDRVGVFEYSVEDGTPSAELPNRVPARVKRARMERLMQRQQAISKTRNERWVGREMEVLVESTMDDGRWTIDGMAPAADQRDDKTARRVSESPKVSDRSSIVHRPSSIIGRTFRDAPEIDGQVLVHAGGNTKATPGEFITARITEAREYDLIGEMV